MLKHTVNKVPSLRDLPDDDNDTQLPDRFVATLLANVSSTESVTMVYCRCAVKHSVVRYCERSEAIHFEASMAGGSHIIHHPSSDSSSNKFTFLNCVAEKTG